MVELLDRKLLFVTGKGGVGKTTISAALGLLAASKGKRTLVCELDAKGDLASSFETGPTSFEEPRGGAQTVGDVDGHRGVPAPVPFSAAEVAEGGAHRPGGEDVRFRCLGGAGSSRDRDRRQAVLGGPGAPLRPRRGRRRGQRPHHRPAGRPAGHQPPGPGRPHSPADGMDAGDPFRPAHLRACSSSRLPRRCR